MRIKTVIVSVVAALICALLFSSCSNNAGRMFLQQYQLPEKMSTTRSNVISENNRLELSWDLEQSCVLLRDKQTGGIWSTTPYNVYSAGGTTDEYQGDGVCSMIYLTYIDAENNNEVTVHSYSKATYVTAKKSKGTLLLTFYFDEIGISVPVRFSLDEDSLAVSIENTGITEKDNLITSVSLLPFFASAQNNNSTYLFVPSGSGALMKTDQNVRAARSYCESVYGDDPIESPIYKDTGTQSVKMPVFGVNRGNDGMLSIITEGAESADILASAGDAQYQYSAAYPTFYLRKGAAAYVTGSDNTNNKLYKYADGVVSTERFTVKYYPLSSGQNDYNGMAKKYREYLARTEGLKSNISTPDTMFSIYGGFQSRKLFLGVPYHSLTPLTDFDGAQYIVDDFKNKTGASSAVNLKGFFESGLDSGKFAGNFKVASKLGGNNGLKSFGQYCTDNGVDSFLDFDLVYYSKSGSGFTTRNSAVTANGLRAKRYDYNIVTREQESAQNTYLASRSLMSSSAYTLADKMAGLGITGAGLSTLSNVAYSDYSSADTYCKAGMANDVKHVIESVNNKNMKTFGESANAYAAAKLDYIFNTPSTSSEYHALDEDIPFYQMVFKGSAAISGGTINLAANEKTEFLRTISAGCSLAFTVCKDFDADAVLSGHSAIGESVYDDISSDIAAMTKQAKPFLDKVRTAAIESYERVGDLSKTVFDNGVTVYVNFGTENAKTELGDVQPQSFIFK